MFKLSAATGSRSDNSRWRISSAITGGLSIYDISVMYNSSGASHTDVCLFFLLFRDIWHVSLSWDILQIHQFVGTSDLISEILIRPWRPMSKKLLISVSLCEISRSYYVPFAISEFHIKTYLWRISPTRICKYLAFHILMYLRCISTMTWSNPKN